ncbi:MAG: hypothetical protein GTO14_11485 [Anaerolineales bacterium]|nr:hypothetical protein [Anaerolineales bacterium]
MDRQLLKSPGRVLQIILGVGLIVYLGRYVVLRWQEVSDVDLALHFPWLLASSLLLVFFYGLYSLTWQRILRWIDQQEMRLSRLTLMRIFFVSFLTRYLPAGTLWNVGGRIELLKREGGRRSVGFESILFEQMYLMGGSIFLAAGAIYLFPQEGLHDVLQQYRLLFFLGGVVGCLLLLTAPDWFLWLTARLLQRSELAKTSDRLTFTRRFEIFVRFVLANLIQGAAGVFVLLAVYPPLLDNTAFLPVFTAAYPFSRFVGQVVAFLPGGVGIREGTFVLLLGPFLPIKPLVAAAALMRLLSVVIELIMLAIVLVLHRFAGVAPRSELGGTTSPNEIRKV